MMINLIDDIKKDKENWFNGYVCLMINMCGNLQEYDYMEYDKFIEKDFTNGEYYDVYATPNTFRVRKRNKDNLLQLRMLWQDIDNVKDIDATIKAIDKLVLEDKIPKYHKIVNSGRGIHVKWIIRDYAGTQKNIKAWESLQRYFYKQLKSLGADRNAIDVARVLRIVGTYNSKSNTLVKEIVDNNFEYYDLYELYDKFIYKPYKEQEKVQDINKNDNIAYKNKSKDNNTVTLTRKSLNECRLMDLEKLLELRNNEMYDIRNKFMMLYGTYYLLRGYSVEATEQRLLELNEIIKSKHKTSKSEIRTIIRNGLKRVNNSNEENIKLLLPKNETIIEMLQITEEEEKFLKTIINNDTKNNRRNEHKRANRRNEEGLTNREAKKKEIIEKIQELKAKGLTQSVAKEKLNVSITTIKRYWNKSFNID